MKILMLCPMLSSSSMITAYPMAKVLSKKHDVRLVGPLLGGENYIKDRSLRFEAVEPPVSRPLQLAMLSLYPKNLAMLLREDYDVVHAFKLLPHTAPAASMAKRLKGRKFVLSIDDYDAASSGNPAKRAVMKLAELSRRNADAITVSSSGLQRLYGGELIYHVSNEPLFINRGKAGAAAAKKRLGIGGKTMIFHAGTFYQHKGLDILIRAVQSLGRKDIRLVLAGDGSDEQRLRKLAGPETVFAGRQPIERVAEMTAAADIYAIPTADTEYSRAEIPGKIFEPMMLGKPIAASGISDIPQMLGNGTCGMLAKPGDVRSLAAALSYLLDNPAEAKRMGRNARARYLKNYGMENLEKKLNAVYRRVEDGT